VNIFYLQGRFVLYFIEILRLVHLTACDHRRADNIPPLQNKPVSDLKLIVLQEVSELASDS